MGVMWLIPILAVCALLFAAYKASYVSRAPSGTPRMQEISAAIAEGRPLPLPGAQDERRAVGEPVFPVLPS